MQPEKERGYSAYIFAKDVPSDYCVIDQENLYKIQRLYMNVGGLLLIIAIMIGAPMILVAVYDNLRMKLERDEAKESTNVLSFFWSFVLVSALADMIILVLDVLTITYNIKLYPSHPNGQGFHDIYIYFILFFVLLFVMIVGDSISMSFALRYIKPSKDFPAPKLLEFIKKLLSIICVICQKQENHGTPQQEQSSHERTPLIEHKKDLCRWCQQCYDRICLTLLGSIVVTLFFQLICFHSLYIVLGVMSTPIETLSITAFYIAYFFCFVAFLAIILKSSNKSEFYESFKWINLLKFIFLLVAAIFFVTSAVFFILYFHHYVIMVQNYSNDGGFTAIIGSILPSALVTFGGYCATKLIRCTTSHSPPTGGPALQQNA